MDYSSYRLVNRLADRTGWAHGIVRVYAKDGIALFAVLLLVGWAVARASPSPRPVAAVVWSASAALVGLAVNQAIGHAVHRARPYASHPGAHLLVSRTSDFSFPSDHAVVAGAVAMGLCFVSRRVGVIAAVAAVAMAFARVYVGAHYPGDVAAGLMVGAAIALIGNRWIVPLLAPVVARLRLSRLRPLVAMR